MEKPATAERPHDLVSYRDTGELSDLTVVVDSERELPLHRFPLYIKSDYFRERASESRVSLPAKFPGGSACFELVADFCYGKRIDIGPDNCVQLNAAAKLLGMGGRDNLADLTDRYLDEILRSAQHSRSMGPVVELLAKATAISQADNADDGEAEADPAVKAIAERCFSTLLDAWTRQQPFGSGGAVGERLLRLPLTWFARLVGAATADSDRHRRALAELSARYLHRVFLRDARLEKSKAAAAASEADGDAEQRQAAGSDAEADESSSTHQQRDGDGDDDGKKEKSPGRRNWRKTRPGEDDAEREDDSQFVPQEPAGQVLDQVILALPESTPLAEVISAEWIQQALRISEKFGCQCRGRLLQLAGNSLHKFRPEELHQMASPVLCDIVGSSVRNKGVQPEVLACVIDNHLLDLAREGSLEPDDFVKLAGSVPAEFRDGHDTLYEVVETLLGSGKSIPDDQQQQILGMVDLSRCDVETLQRALEKGVMPAKTVCLAAIELARKLRHQLDSRTGGSGGAGSGLRLRDEIRSGSRFARRSEPPSAVSGFHRQTQLHVGGGGVGLGSSSVHYADPYIGRGYLDDDAYGETAELSSGSRYTAQDYDVDLLLLEAERSAQQQQQQQRSANYPYYQAQYGRSRRW
ncbi:hypothetical protein BOX15_Mlig026640g1 [Macrostomum lignano]|uniref:BTB domain-containing protein n=1 Tax=Macrostomum lignano TaxID=282301 RepID=A0A267H2A3_9PLAT|nr:hypothetical protein BOX15_Mlig026640g1 [Macrostomum lignano]